ncbi:MAG: biopolymer transporter ExbD [bacterium]
MSVLKKKRPEASREISMASTSDVAFLLLIFFIVTTIFAAEQGLIMVLPAKQTKADMVKVKQSNVATIKVLASNLVTLDERLIEINHIKSEIQDRLDINAELVVILEIHPDADYGQMIACLDELRLANARKVSLKTTE